MCTPSYRTTQFRVRYSETDQMKVVYHINYLNWFEIGRTEFLRTSGYVYRDLEEKGVLLPVTDVGLKCKAPARYDDLVEVRTWISHLSSVRLDFCYEIWRISGELHLLVTGYSKHVFTNPAFKPTRLPRLFPDVYAWLEAEHERYLASVGVGVEAKS